MSQTIRHRFSRFAAAAACTLIASLAGDAAAAVIHVNAAAGGFGNGSSWAQATPFLNDALAMAQPGDEIWVARGTYYPDTSGANPAGSGDRLARFHMKTGVKILGGFLGNETSADQRDPATHLTVLSADIGVRDNHSDNSYGIVMAENLGPGAVLDGFTLRRGMAYGDASDDRQRYGGGVFVRGGQATFRNLRFEHNRAKFGSGIGIVSNADVKVENCYFYRGGDYGITGGGNVAAVGGGISVDGASNINLSDSTFEGGWTLYGGAVYSNFYSTGTIARCRFIDNVSVNGGAMSFAGFTNITVRECYFLRNESKQLGFFQTSWNGGAVRNWCTPSRFINCVFVGNKAWGPGGAFWDGGPSSSSGTIINCTFVANWSRDGGTVSNATGHTTHVRNSIIWANTANGSNPTTVMGNIPLANSCVEGMAALDANGNTGLDPLFVSLLGPDGVPNSGDEDLRLTSASPCIDTGNNALVPAGITTDFFGNDRFVGQVDMGAIEFAPPPPPPCYGDANGDRVVNFSDITAVLNNWGATYPGGTGPGDADLNGTVAFPDITAVLNRWGHQCDEEVPS